MKLSIIIPVLNESACIEYCLKHIKLLGLDEYEIIIVDGGSTDNTLNLVSSDSDKLIQTSPSRSLQMNAGAKEATGDVLLFLHVDTFLPEHTYQLIQSHQSNEKLWGRFDIKLTGKNPVFRLIENLMNFRSRLTGIATGDQAIFVETKLFHQINGFPELELMEDIAISKILKKINKPVCLKSRVTSSSRRWEENGILKTILKMWLLRFLYFLDVETKHLAKIYQ